MEPIRRKKFKTLDKVTSSESEGREEGRRERSVKENFQMLC